MFNCSHYVRVFIDLLALVRWLWLNVDNLYNAIDNNLYISYTVIVYSIIYLKGT